MNLRWNAFEKSLSASVKCYDACSGMTFWQRLAHVLDTKSPAGSRGSLRGLKTIRIVSSICLVFFIVVAPHFLITPRYVMMIGLGFWSLLVTIMRTETIRYSGDIAECRALWMLPLSPDGILRQFRRHIDFELTCLFVESLSVFTVIALATRHPLSNGFAGTLLAMLQTAFSFTVTLLLLRTRTNGGWLAFPFLAFLFLLAIMAGDPADHALRLTVISLSNPFGWIGVAYFHGWIRGEGSGWWFLLPSLAIVSTLPNSLRAFRRMHHHGQFRKNSPIPGQRLRIPLQEETPPQPEDKLEDRKQVLSGDFLQPLPWNERGLVERLLTRILNPEETEIAKSILISPAIWTRRFLRFAICVISIWLVNSAIHYRSLAELAARPEQGKTPTILAVIFNIILFGLALRLAAQLFCWRALPTFVPRILPMRAFAVWKAAAKINALVLALLFSLSLLIPASPFGLRVLSDGSTGIGMLAGGVVLLGHFSFFGVWTGNARLFGRWGKWPFQIVAIIVICAQLALGFVLGFALLPNSPVPLDFSLAPVLIASGVGWNYLCGFLELKAWTSAASTSRTPS